MPSHPAASIDPLRTYDVATVAELLQLTTDSVRTLIAGGQLPASNVAATSGKARWRVTAADLAEFLAARRNVQPAAQAKRPAKRQPYRPVYLS